MQRKNKIKNFGRHIGITGCFALYILFCLPLFHQNVYASDPVAKELTIAYFDFPGFIDQTGYENSEYEYLGYGVDYLEEISKHTNWNYKYIHAGIQDCYEMLKNGEADIICYSQRKAELDEDFLFSDYPIHVESTGLYALKNDNRYYYDDYEAFDGMRVAVMKGSNQLESLKEYALEHQFSVTYRFYDTVTDMFNALNTGEVDTVLSGDMIIEDNIKKVAECSYDNYYIISTTQNIQIMDELNVAMAKINNDKYWFAATLYINYYGNTSANTTPSFTREEVEYIKNSGRIQVGQLANRQPVSEYNKKTGEFSGITEDIMDTISKMSGLQFSYVKISYEKIPIKFLETGDVDLIAGIINSNNYQERKDIVLTDSYYTGSIVMVADSGKTFQMHDQLIVAIPAYYSSLLEIIKDRYPQFTFQLFDDEEDSMNAVKDGNADITIQNSFVVSVMLQQERYHTLEIVPTYFMLEPMTIAGTSDTNPLLISILNKSINALDLETINQIIVNHTIGNPYRLTFMDFYNKYMYMLFTIIFLIIICIVLCVHTVIQKQRNLKELQEKNIYLEKANQLAENASRAKSMFLSHISHEIRTPMTAILGLTELTKKHVDDKKLLEEYFVKITYSSKVLMNIINDVLDMSAIENQKMKINSTPFDMKQVFDAVASIYIGQCELKNMRLVVNYYLNDVMLIGDPLRISQILMNLFSNAIKFTEEGGIIKLEVSDTTDDTEACDANNDFRMIRISVSDTGCGIGEEMQSRIFEPFEQESSSTAQKYGGSGLGLSIVQSLVKLMNGTINVESVKNEGTTFYIDLPMRILHIDESTLNCKNSSVNIISFPKDVDSEDNSAYAGIRILLAEDNEINREIMAEVLSTLGLHVDSVKNGFEAYETFRSSIPGTYQGIFMDIQMPLMDGLEATRRIRADIHEQAQTIPILAMTANAYIKDVAATEEAGMNGYLKKPVDINQIREVLTDICKDGYCDLNQYVG